ncbi:Mannose glucose-specific lectin [Musa troglodytarum]|uniref:Mannose glucose-specific lectin n=1 Tax=Musa troglodytarum TaxID=320322 RepID=A0A9E7H702_9LILI|nr:Mannose glucose-specific lectin [Musa troglodytarum]
MFNVLFEELGYGPTHAILNGHVPPGGVGHEASINTPIPSRRKGVHHHRHLLLLLLIPLQEDEYLVGIEGSVDTLGRITLVRNLTLRTNKKSHGPFGTSGGKPFSVPVASGKITGFFGRAGTMIDAIGVYLAPN